MRGVLPGSTRPRVAVPLVCPPLSLRACPDGAPSRLPQGDGSARPPTDGELGPRAGHGQRRRARSVAIGDADAGTGDGHLRNRVLPVVLDGAAHHEQIALAEEERQGAAATAWVAAGTAGAPRRSRWRRGDRPGCGACGPRARPRCPTRSGSSCSRSSRTPGRSGATAPGRPPPAGGAGSGPPPPSTTRPTAAPGRAGRTWARVRCRHGSRATSSAKTWSEPSSHRGRWSSQLVSSSASRRTPCNDGSNPGSPAANRLACHSTVSSRTVASCGPVSQRSASRRPPAGASCTNTCSPYMRSHTTDGRGAPARGFSRPVPTLRRCRLRR